MVDGFTIATITMTLNRHLKMLTQKEGFFIEIFETLL